MPAIRTWLTVLSLVLPGYASTAAPCKDATIALPSIDPQALRTHMRFLSDDLLEGRGTASRGHEIAARYMAAQFAGASGAAGQAVDPGRQ
jgi:hypothetical protein